MTIMNPTKSISLQSIFFDDPSDLDYTNVKLHPRASTVRCGLQEDDGNIDDRPLSMASTHGGRTTMPMSGISTFMNTDASTQQCNYHHNHHHHHHHHHQQQQQHHHNSFSSTASVGSSCSSTSMAMSTIAAPPAPPIAATAYKSTPLPYGFQPGPYDVICARGKYAWNSPGNRYFRSLVDEQVEQYASTKNKAERSVIVSNIVDTVRSKSSGGGFIKQEADGGWVEVGDTLAREKVGQLFRNALASSYKSSNRSKKRRRDEVAHKFQQSLTNVMIQNETVLSTTQDMAEYARQPKIADDDVVELFTKRNSDLLEGIIKPDRSLVDKFTRTFSAGMNHVGDDEDGDTKMD